MRYRLEELLDIGQLGPLLASLTDLLQVSFTLLDQNGSPLLKNQGLDLCEVFHAQSPEARAACWRMSADARPKAPPEHPQPCQNGLLECFSPLLVGGEPVGTLMLGQCSPEPVEEAFFRRNAQTLGLPEAEYLEAARQVPVVSEARLEQLKELLSQLAHLFGALGLERLQRLEAAGPVAGTRQLAGMDEPPHGILMSRSGQVLYVNAPLVQMLGLSASHDLLGQPVFSLLVPQGVPTDLIDFLAGQGHPGPPTSFEAPIRRWDGSSVHCKIKVLSFDKEDPTARLILVQDLEQLRRSEARLLSRARQYRMLTETMKDVVWLVDVETNHLRYVSPSTERLTGYTAEELMAGSVLAFLPPEAVQHAQELLTQLSKRLEQDPHLQEEYTTLQLEMMHKDGRPVWTEVVANLYRDPEDGRLCLRGVTRDISQQKRIEQELREALARAEAATQVKQAFLSSVSHELRSPLTAILGFSDLLRRDASLPAKSRRQLEVIHRSGEMLLKMINDLLQLARLELEAVTQEAEPVEVDRLVEDILEMLSLSAHQKGVALCYERALELPRVLLADASRLRPIILNLVDHAIRVTPTGRITVKATPGESKQWEVEVYDQGPALDPGEIRLLFQPFSHVAGASRSGLGLAVALRATEQLGGRLTLENLPGSGNLSRLVLPMQLPAETGLPPARTAPERPMCLEAGQEEVRLLIVDDEEEARLLMHHLLEESGFTIQLAANGHQALGLLSSFKPHLILMDRRMPQMDGMEATRRIRAMPGGDQVRIVGLTASTFEDEHAQLKGSGMDAVLSKPFSLERLLETLASLAGRRLVTRLVWAGEKAAQSHPPAPVNWLELPAEEYRSVLKILLALDLGELRRVKERLDATLPSLGARLGMALESLDFSSLLAELDSLETGEEGGT